MPDAATLLTLQFLRWIASGRRRYSEVREAWRSTCPRLTPWEDAIDGGLVGFLHKGERLTDESEIVLTTQGQRMLDTGSCDRLTAPR